VLSGRRSKVCRAPTPISPDFKKATQIGKRAEFAEEFMAGLPEG